ncbi:hypothetical protein M5362_25005 [Streptomyces sp. Je 1-79]|uniref:hypothetical protein n=1 Tax=Streptomyces sp. Je 1-79 TaxID=2943847 RepID=UPI0021A88634|nr:hypothetical protein [Streptomyces sp. Je 1-79]MCT4356391.1 hypothetical protein [Streptomyces sp. Je 1-79]
MSSLPGQFSDPRVITLVAVLAVSTMVWVALGLRARARRARAEAPLERVWHPQESVSLTPAEEQAFGAVASRLSMGSAGRLR